MGDATTYLCRGRLKGCERIFLWETSDRDCVVVDEAGNVVSFTSESEARVTPPGIAGLSDESPAFYDFDATEVWCLSDDETVDCPSTLNMWNLLNDIPRTQDLFSLAESRADGIYNKLFYGCNLPAMGASPDDQYVPSWTSEEIRGLKRLLLLGLNDFRMRCSSWQAAEPGVAG